MLDDNSRYRSLETATLTVQDADGRTTSYLYTRRRFLPRLRDQTTMLEHPVRQGDRLDNLSVGYYQDPLAAYRLADANPVLHPEDLLLPGRSRIRIAMPFF